MGNFYIPRKSTLGEHVSTDTTTTTTTTVPPYTQDTSILSPEVQALILGYATLSEQLGGYSVRPLGEGMQTRYTSADGKEIEAEQYLREELGYKYVYYPTDAREVAIAIASDKAAMAYIKTQMANVGLIDGTKTVGLLADGEFIKGMKTLMELSMNSGGKMSWQQSLETFSYDYKSRRALIISTPTLDKEEIDDLVDSTLATAKQRKGSPLSQEEKDYIADRVSGVALEFNEENQDLSPGRGEQFIYGQVPIDEVPEDALEDRALVKGPFRTTVLPAVEGEEPDVEGLTEDVGDVVEGLFAPREELARQQGLVGRGQARTKQVIQGLTGKMKEEVKR